MSLGQNSSTLNHGASIVRTGYSFNTISLCEGSVKELENAKIKTRKYFSVENEVQAAPDENSEQFSDDEGQSSSAENESEIESVKE